MTDTVRLSVSTITLAERDVRLRMPFRFGVVTMRAAPQAFVHVAVRLEDGRTGWGQAAEILAPKWFDKTPDLTNEQNFDQLRRSLAVAAGLYRAAEADTPFGLHAAIYPDQIEACGRENLNPLVASFGPALIDRAVIDALGRLAGESVFSLVNRNTLGIDARLTPDLADFDLSAGLATLRPAPSIAARHTVGLVDAILEDDIPAEERLSDGLPQSLEAAIAHYGLRYFKLKVGGDLEADLARLQQIAAVLDRIDGEYFATLDGNEQYASVEPVIALAERIAADTALARLWEAILFIEQPINRKQALARDIAPLAALKPVEIDESDATLESFREASRLGYRGVSSKACKGVYRSLLNRARMMHWNAALGRAAYFMSAEDLTTQAGIAVQQDLAIATLIGCTHVERNGHHYVDGMAGAPADEAAAFLAAHPDLYAAAGGSVRLRIQDGRIGLGSLDVAGFAVAPLVDAAGMEPQQL